MEAFGGELHTLGGRVAGQGLEGEGASDGKECSYRANLSPLDKVPRCGSKCGREIVCGVTFATKDLADAGQQRRGVAELRKKSRTALSLLGMLFPPAHIVREARVFHGVAFCARRAAQTPNSSESSHTRSRSSRTGSGSGTL